MNFPPKTVGLITPSSPLFPGRLEATIYYFESLGLKVRPGKHNKKADRFLAGSDQGRAEDIMSFFADKLIDALVVTGVGAGSIRTLNHLEHDVIKQNPKPIIGFIDTTALQLGIYAKTGNINYMGFTGKDVAETNDSLPPLLNQTFLNCINNKNFSIQEGEMISPGSISAPLVGGNLMCLANLIGTPYQPDFSNKILFIEDVWAEPYMIDGRLDHLNKAGVYKEIGGLIFGTIVNCDAKHFPNRDGTVDDVIHDWFYNIKLPCIKDFPYGHIDNRCVLPIGQWATLNADDASLSIHFSKNSDHAT